ncbi:MAG: glycoside hydrolase family 15 protein [Minisyncoccia bacterium]
MNIDFDLEIKNHLAEILKLRKSTGVFTASAHSVGTGYDKAWLRDNYFSVLGFLEAGDIEVVRSTARALLGVFLKHAEKINWAIENKPHETWQYIHARFHPESFEEYWEEWGNRQNDAVGEVLALITELELRGLSVAETEEEKVMVQKIVDYLINIEYWHDEDNGIWEEAMEVHASSIAAVVAALKKAHKVSWLTVPEGSIEKGEEALRALLPRESKSKFADLALLTILYPFHEATEEETQVILRNVEYHLTRDKGVIRYKGDRYYNENEDGYSEEAEWCMGLSWLSIIYAERGEREKAEDYLLRAQETITEAGKIPELYYSHSEKPNENTPLCWAESMYVVALKKVRDMAR